MAAADLAPCVFVGVDSGGTRTNVEVEMRSGEEGSPLQTSYEVAESLSGALPNELVPRVLRSVLAPLETHIGGNSDGLPVYVWISAAGYTPWTRDTYLVALNDLSPKIVEGGIERVGVANDAVSVLLGMRADGVIIAGTGSNVIVRARDGCLYQAGGHEWVACDYGSGFWIGLRGIREAYRDYENEHLTSVLLGRLWEHYGVAHGDRQGLVEKLRYLAVGDEDLKKEIARFAPTVCAAAERGDKPSQNLVKLEAEDLADVTAGALRRRFSRAELTEGIRLVQCGSVLSSSFYRTSFETQLEMRLLSGTDQTAVLEWERVIIGTDPAVQLARDLAADADQYLGLDTAFRPAVVEA